MDELGSSDVLVRIVTTLKSSKDTRILLPLPLHRDLFSSILLPRILDEYLDHMTTRRTPLP